MQLLRNARVQLRDALARFCAYREYFNIGISHFRKLNDLVHVEIKIRQNVDLVDYKRIADLEYKRIFQRLVVSLRNGEDHGVFRGARVKLRRANEVADVFENDEVEIVRSHFRKSLTGHVCVEVAHAAGVQLDHLFNARMRDALGVNVGVYIRFHYADVHFIAELFDRARQGRCLAAAGRRHEI